MSSGCSDLRKRWDNLVGSSEKDAVDAIRRDGKNSFLLSLTSVNALQERKTSRS